MARIGAAGRDLGRIATGAGSRIRRATKTEANEPTAETTLAITADDETEASGSRRRRGGRRGRPQLLAISPLVGRDQLETLGERSRWRASSRPERSGRRGFSPSSRVRRQLAGSRSPSSATRRLGASGIWTAKLATNESKLSSATPSWRRSRTPFPRRPRPRPAPARAGGPGARRPRSPCAASTAPSSRCKRASWGSISTARCRSPRAAAQVPCSRWIAAASPRLAAERTPLGPGLASTINAAAGSPLARRAPRASARLSSVRSGSSATTRSSIPAASFGRPFSV